MAEKILLFPGDTEIWEVTNLTSGTMRKVSNLNPALPAILAGFSQAGRVFTIAGRTMHEITDVLSGATRRLGDIRGMPATDHVLCATVGDRFAYALSQQGGTGASPPYIDLWIINSYSPPSAVKQARLSGHGTRTQFSAQAMFYRGGKFYYIDDVRSIWRLDTDGTVSWRGGFNAISGNSDGATTIEEGGRERSFVIDWGPSGGGRLPKWFEVTNPEGGTVVERRAYAEGTAEYDAIRREPGRTSTLVTWRFTDPLVLPRLGSRRNTIGEDVRVVLPLASGGLTPLFYSQSGQLPPELAFDSTTRTITGTVIGPPSRNEITWSVRDSEDETRSSSFLWVIESDLEFAEIPDQTNIVGDTVNFALTRATGTSPPFAYVLTGDLPPGVFFSASTATFTGVIGGSIATYEVTVTVTDIHGESVERSFTWIVPSGITPIIANKRNQVGDIIHTRLPLSLIHI